MSRNLSLSSLASLRFLGEWLFWILNFVFLITHFNCFLSFFLFYEFSKLAILGSSLLPKLSVVSLSYNQVSRIFSALYRVRTKERKDVLAAILNSILFGSRNTQGLNCIAHFTPSKENDKNSTGQKSLSCHRTWIRHPAIP